MNYARLAIHIIVNGITATVFGLMVLLMVGCGFCVGLVWRLFSLPGRLIERAGRWSRS